jgi:hypothetical protein
MDHKATGELLFILINNLNRNLNASLNPNPMVANSWVTDPGNELPEELPAPAVTKKKIILAGASNMRRLVPALKMNGYEVIDLSLPSWQATSENISTLADRIASLHADGGSVMVLELFGNSTFRYRQFDGTMALPFKSGHGYHMEGEVGVCDDISFNKLLSAVQPVLEACGSGTKIIVPPLPRYLYTGCCNSKSHCTNLRNEDYELNMLQSTMHFRPLIKDNLLAAGHNRFFVLDGIGALLGIPAGNNRGTAVEILRELNKYCAADGVHYNELGYANLAKVITSAISGVESGTLTKSEAGSGSLSGNKRNTVFFWRGFTSPVGYSGPRTNPPASTTPTTVPATARAGAAGSAGATMSEARNFTRGGSRGGGFMRAHYKDRRCPYWKKR